MVKYSPTIEWTKFENASELAEFLSGSFWWDREWDGLQYDYEKWCKIQNQIIKENNSPKGEDIYFPIKVKETQIKPFWEEQLKQYDYKFPLYFRRNCFSESGYSTCFSCKIGTKEDYIKEIQEKIINHEKEIMKLKALITEAVI